ncbi:TLD domain-containing protein [Roseivirga thermotolerans]|uniref:TLD domain-containing protein n=1 Tax=Roseivirga thermotolerans TaxID=1758176 RepID=UPI00273E3D18|nr:immunoglobulin-like domain-containing protein [Roseivirga thermotolerans]
MKRIIQLNLILLMICSSALYVNAQTTFPILPGSVMSDSDDNAVLRGWLDDLGIAPSGTLLYRRSRDGANSTVFHSRVDGQGPTLVIFKLNNGTVFGGYSPESWSSSSGGYRHNQDAFLFNLTTNQRASTYYPQYSIYTSSSYGPTFGGGHDIFINSTMDGGYFNVHSYNSVDGSGYRSSTALKALTGINTSSTYYSFSSGLITEIEVYKVEFNSSGPIIQGQDIVVQLDENGQATISAEDIDNGTTDPDGPVTLSIDVNTFNCDNLGGNSSAINMESLGFVSRNVYSHGGGYNPHTNEFWYPGWSNSTVYRLNPSGNLLGTFNSGQTQMMQLWMDLNSEDYYTANWSYNTITRRSGTSTVWTYNMGRTASCVTTDADYVYAYGVWENVIRVLNKQTGQFIRNINLPGTIYTWGTMAVANGYIYIGGRANGWSDFPNNYQYLHQLDMDGNYITSIYTGRNPYSMAFDGEVMWIDQLSNNPVGIKIANGNAYEGGGGSNAVTLTATDPLGNYRTQTFSVTVEDNIAPTIQLNGASSVFIATGETFNDPGATASDNCSAEVEVSGSVDTNTPGSYTLSYKAIDGSGNESAVVTRTVEVGEPITITPWRISDESDDIVSGISQGFRGDPNAYQYANIPPTSDLSWQVAPLDGSGNILFGSGNSSKLGGYPCGTALDFTYFETFVDIPADIQVNELTVTFGQVDDGVRAYIFNSAYPNGTYRGELYGGTNFSQDYSDLAVPGELNRIVIVQFDDCAVGNNLRDANITINGSPVPVNNSAPPVAIAQDITVALGDDGTFNLQPSHVDNGSFSTLAGPVTLTLDQTYTFSCADNGTTTAVTLTATDTNGEQASTTANVTINGGLDTDLDGIPNSCDLDDDNDGILDTVECSSSVFHWSNAPTWSSGHGPTVGRSARGTINGIGYTYTSNVNFRLTGNLFGHQKFPNELEIPNQTSIRNDYASQNTLTFDEPMTNPVLVFASIGGGPTVTIQFEDDFDILWIESNTTSYNTQARTVTGKEGNVVIRFNGTFNELNFDYLNDETYVNFAFGADFFSLCDFDLDGITNNLDLDSDGDGCADSVEGGLGLGLDAINADGTLSGTVDSNGVPLSANGGQGVGTSASASATCECELGIDQTAPNVVGKNISVTLTSSGTVSISPQDVLDSGSDNCNPVTYTLSQDTFGANDASNSPVTVQLTGTDPGGNATTVDVQVTVIDPVPVVITRNITVFLDASGQVTIAPEDVDNGSSSVVGLSGLSLDVSSFDCSNVGNNTVTLTATSTLGSQASGTANVFVADEIAPTITVQNATVQLDQNGFGSIQLSDILTSATDNCGIASQTATDLSFDCTEVGDNTVTVTVTDVNGRVTQRDVTVTVLDVLPIIAEEDNFTLDSCQPITFTVADLLGNDSDPYGETLKVDFVGQPSSGSIVDNGNGTFTYTPGQSTNHTATAEYIVKRDDGTVVFSGNGHFYEFVTAPGITWSDAKVAAEARTYNGQQGYLVTITSAAENDFAKSKLQGQGWIGANDSQVEGEWRWVTGPEAGTLFYRRSTGPVNGAYHNWAGGEPNDYRAGGFFVNGEDVAHFLSDGRWNDYPNNVGTAIAGYVVEYGGNAGDCDIQSAATGTITFELNDAVAPIALAQDLTVNLANGGALITPQQVNAGSSDACGIQSLSLDKEFFTCQDLGQNTVTLTVTDVNGNSTSTTAVVTVRDVTMPYLNVINRTFGLDENGQVNITPQTMYNSSNDDCGGPVVVTIDKSSFDCSNIGDNIITVTSTDESGNQNIQQAILTIVDAAEPEVVVRDYLLVELDENGNASITPADLDLGSNDNCGIDRLEISQSTFTCADVGTLVVTTRAYDVNGNMDVNRGQTLVEVRDVTNPVVQVNDITVQLNSQGVATITPQQIDNGSADACGIATLALDKTNFDCSNVGANTVTLTVTDVNGNASTATATVIVEDNIAPVVITQDVTVELDANGSASITTALIDNGSSDACGIATMTLDKTSFDCSNVGSNTVTLTVTDTNGNMSTATATVSVVDVIAPTVFTQNLTVYLDENGEAGITPEGVDNGSFDNCSFTLSLDKLSFDCSNVGENTVSLTATDASGNTTTAQAIITVIDNIQPTVVPQHIDVFLDEQGAASIVVADVDGGTFDNCGIASLTIDTSGFGCEDLGQNNVTLTATDVNGNVNTGIAIVTVIDNIAPTVNANDIALELDENGQASFTAEDVLIYSEDDIERPTECDVTDATDHGMFLKKYVPGNAGNAPIVGINTDNVLNGQASHSSSWNKWKKKWKGKNGSDDDDDDKGDDDDDKGGDSDDDDGGKPKVKDARFTFTSAGVLTRQLDGTATVTGVLQNLNDATDQWEVTLNLSQGYNWQEWRAMGKTFKGDWWTVWDKYKDWTYFELLSGQLVGQGRNAGEVMPLENGDDKFGFQLGDGANDKDADYGMSGWINYTNLKGEKQRGDFNFDIANCGLVPVPDGTVYTSDNCSIASTAVDVSDFTCLQLGTNTVNVSVTDQSGNTTTVPITVTINDYIAPVAVSQNITVGLGADGTVVVDPALLDGGSTDNTDCPLTFSIDRDTFSCDDVGKGTYYYEATEGDSHKNKKGKGHNYGDDDDDNDPGNGYAWGHKKGTKKKGHKVTLTVTDAAGNSSSTTAYITIVDDLAPVFSSEPATIVVYNEEYRKGRKVYTKEHTEYLKDKDVEPLVSDNCGVYKIYFDKKRFGVADAGMNQVAVAAKDKAGNIGYGQINVEVIDISNLGKYIEMCYKGRKLVVKRNKVQDMIRRGATLGACDSGNIMTASKFTLGEPAQEELFVPELKLESYPNPTRGVTTFKISSNVSGSARMALLSTSGIELEEVFSGELEANTEVEVGYDAGQLPSGMYIVRLVTAGQVRNLKLMVEK